MEDYFFRGITKDGAFRIIGARTTRLVEEARRRHQASPTAIAALGRVMTAAVLLSADLKKEDHRVMIQIQGGGPLGEILAEADGRGRVRGYIQRPAVHLPPTKAKKLDVGGAVGSQGFFSVTKDLGLKEPYQGSVPLVSGEIAEDLSYYLSVSEQIPSAAAIGVLVETTGEVRAAGGILFQTMPEASEEAVAHLEKALKTMPPLTSLLSQGFSPEEIAGNLLDPGVLTILETRPLVFGCRCSRQRVEKALIALGAEEIKHLMEEQKTTEISCDFCRTSYFFDRRDLQRLLEEISASKDNGHQTRRTP
ncbi:Hsp33 family molecular chaperone HslO [Thermosulfuriphilus sp.]